MEHQIRNLTAQIVSAHIANNVVSAGHLSAFIRGVHQALIAAGQKLAEPPKIEPAVAVKNSVFADHIVCLDCGANFKMLKRHLSSEHQMTPSQYRIKWGLPPSYAMVAAEYAATRAKMARDMGLGPKSSGARVEADPAKAVSNRKAK